MPEKAVKLPVIVTLPPLELISTGLADGVLSKLADCRWPVMLMAVFCVTTLPAK